MPFSLLLMFALLLTFTLNVDAQDKPIKVMFYNVENLFDIADDSLTDDDEFTPGGEKHWTNRRLHKKLNGIYKVIMAAGDYEPPQLIGLAEVENSEVLDMLISYTPLKAFGYQHIHFDSDDRRGIDVALLYREVFFQPVIENIIEVRFPFEPGTKTRNILHVKGFFADSVILNVFVNHWPSRYGGVNASEQKRIYAAETLSNYLKSFFCKGNVSDENILIMGDFNDEPQDISLEILSNNKKNETFECPLLYNLFFKSMPEHPGTIKYQTSWFVFDQIIVSRSLVNGSKGLKVDGGMEIFAPDFLLVDDERNMGKKTYRTYTGPRYLGGISDHLPVMVNLKFVCE